MADERWRSPFAHTIAFALFKKHFTELNRVYWAHVPAANTIEKKAFEALKSDDADPKAYFLIQDKDDRRMELTYLQWKKSYREFSNYTRLSMLMLLSSCFETYLRTIISLALESKPGILIQCADAVDGWFLYREDPEYGDYKSKKYQFIDAIENVCQGEWFNRAKNYEKLFGNIPLSASDIAALDDLRQKRNMVGHFFGREKHKYEVPLYFNPDPVQHVSHGKLMEYFRLVFDVANNLDMHLHEHFIGSYDIIKYFYQHSKSYRIVDITAGDLAKELQKMIGELGFSPPGREYYQNIISYTLLDDKSDVCRYSRRSCVYTINKN